MVRILYGMVFLFRFIRFLDQICVDTETNFRGAPIHWGQIPIPVWYFDIHVHFDNNFLNVKRKYILHLYYTKHFKWLPNLRSK